MGTARPTSISLATYFVIFYIYTLLLLLVTLGQTQDSGHAKPITNNWAVLVSSSKFWFNYRHAANVLSIYRSIKRLGIDDSHIILMLADDTACDPRNPWPGTVFNNIKHEINVYGSDTEVDYKGDEVTADNFIRLLTGRHLEGTPRSKKLLTDDGSNILIYLTGHGGDGFLKFQDKSELLAIEFAEAIAQMHTKKRYNEILFVADTCQAESLSSRLNSPNIIGVGSSKIGQDSLAREGDPTIGLAIIDHFTYRALAFLENQNETTASNTKLKSFFEICPGDACISTVTVRRDLYKRDPSKVPLSDFFGNKHKFNRLYVDDEPLWKEML
uniref:Putative GPI-anchor transamidase n=1 Tax=Aceria tosichella TaxID=561515 RepID=A0A6G1SHR4_9ACAR